jgi:hypothetical protein
MLKNSLLVLSLLINSLALYAAYLFYFPPATRMAKMTCQEARSESDSKIAIEIFARKNGGSFAKTHEFLWYSGFYLRNIVDRGDTTIFVYVATSYSSACGLHLPGIDGTIVRVETDISASPSVKTVF